MVGRVDDARAVGQTRGLERAQDLSDIVVQERHHAVIGGERDAHLLRREEIVVAHAGAQRLYRRVGRVVVPTVETRHRHALGRIHGEELGRRDKREMRLHHRHEQRPGLAQPGCPRGEPLDRAVADVAVVVRVGRFARPCRLRQIGHAAARGRFRAPDQAQQVALPVDDMQRDDLLDEAVVVLGRAEMKLADRHGVMAERTQAVAPAADRAVIGMRVVPACVLRHVGAGLQAGARRHADRTVGVGGGELRAARGERVDVRGPDDPVAVAPCDVAGMLVGQDEQDIGRFLTHRILGREGRKGPPDGCSVRTGNSSVGWGWIAATRVSKAAIAAVPSRAAIRVS